MEFDFMGMMLGGRKTFETTINDLILDLNKIGIMGLLTFDNSQVTTNNYRKHHGKKPVRKQCGIRRTK